jgi:hypothetical protein
MSIIKEPATSTFSPESMEARVELVTPAKALKWLQHAARNRGVSDYTVRRYGSDMLAGRWTVNGQGLIFDTHGRLLDGRHRLTAIQATGAEVLMLVIRGAPAESFETMDSGRTRTLANVLAIEGHKNTTAVGATARLVWCYVAGTSLKYGTSRTELLNLIRAHPYIEDRTSFIANRDALVKPMGVPKSALAAVLTLVNECRKYDAEVDDFAQGFISGEGLFQGDPRLTLRRWLARERNEAGAGGTRIAEPFFAAATRAWTAFAQDRDLMTLRIPMFFNIETMPLEGFDRTLWSDVPDLSRSTFARLGPEPLATKP